MVRLQAVPPTISIQNRIIHNTPWRTIPRLAALQQETQQVAFSYIDPLLASLCFSLFFPLMGACFAQIKGFTLGCQELVLVRPNVKPFI